MVGRQPLARVIDVVIATCGLVVSAPVLAVAALAIRCTSPGPVVFRQARAGRDGEPFQIYKLRTMRHGVSTATHLRMIADELENPTGAAPTDGRVFKVSNNPDVTAVGRLLRRLSIDEIPQLVNVLRGDMSIVGPRPVPMYEHEMYERRYQYRSLVRPGLTGLWQVSGRNFLDTQQMLELDLRYVRERSLRTDLAILVKTPGAVLSGGGAR